MRGKFLFMAAAEIPLYRCLLRTIFVLKLWKSKYELEWKNSYPKLLVKLLLLLEPRLEQRFVLSLGLSKDLC